MLFAVVALLPAWARAESTAFDLSPGTRVLPPIAFRQLAVFPVVKEAAPTVDKTRYLTLKEGLAGKLVTVSEDARGAQVNRVTVANRSNRPLLLLGGEVILGGQQDRILGKDTVVPAGEQISLEVFCVEHGRWNGGRQFTGAGGLADGKMRVRAKFRSDQQQVWEEVAKKNAALKAAPSTGTYRNLAVGTEGERAKKPYREALDGALGKLPQAKLVGLIAAVNGRVTSVDLFTRPELFAAYRDQLLDSIVMSAADTPAPAVAAPPPSATQIRGFIDQAEAAAPREVARHKGSRTVEKSGGDVLNSTVEIETSPAAPAEPVYKSYQRNE
jgi:hypothetical protein